MVSHEETENENILSITPAEPLLLIPTISKENLTKKPNWINKFEGIFYALISSFLFVSATFITQQLGVDLLDAILLRFILQTLLVFAYALYKHYTILGGTIQQIILQIVCAAMGTVGYFVFLIAVRYADLADINTLCYTRVVWTIVLSIIVYRERPSISTLVALPLTLLGVVFVTQPTFLFKSKISSMTNVDYKFRLLGFSLAFGSALTSAINVLLYKQLISTSRDMKPSVLNFQFSVMTLIAIIFYQLYKHFYLQTITSYSHMLSWPYLISTTVSVITIVGSVLVQKAIKREHPAVFSLLSSSDIIFALILQNIFTSVRSNLYALMGSGLVILSVVVIGIARIINEKHEKEKMKQKKIQNGVGKC